MMKEMLRNCFLIGACLLLSSSIVFAEKHRFKIGLETNYFDFNAESAKIDGFMYGLVGTYTRHTEKTMFSVDLRYSLGVLDWETWGATPGKSDRDDWILEGRLLMGQDFSRSNKNSITPFVGIGSRLWNDDGDSAESFERVTHYVYCPFGLKIDNPLSPDWTWGITLEYDLFVFGLTKVHMSDTNPAFNDPELTHNFLSGYGLRFSFRLNRIFAKNHILSIEPYIRYWDIDATDYEGVTFNGIQVSGMRVSANYTTSYGLRLSFKF